jgi:hypothetical protein
MKYYIIEYYNRKKKKREKYMNNTGFESWHSADAEIARLKKADRATRLFYGCILRTRFKILEVNGAKFISYNGKNLRS